MTYIIGLAGSFASGKSKAASVLAEKHNIPVFGFGKLVGELLSEYKVDKNRKTLQQCGWEIIQRIGYEGIAELLCTKNNISEGTSCIIEGIRHTDVSSYYRKKFGRIFKLIYVDCSKETRFDRIKNIEYKGTVILTMEEFNELDNHILETSIEAIKPTADYVFLNEGSKESFAERIMSIPL